MPRSPPPQKKSSPHRPCSVRRRGGTDRVLLRSTNSFGVSGAARAQAATSGDFRGGTRTQTPSPRSWPETLAKSPGRVARAVRAGEPGQSLRKPPDNRGRHTRVPVVERDLNTTPLSEWRTRIGSHRPSVSGVGGRQLYRRRAGAGPAVERSPQAGRLREEPRLHRRRGRCGLSRTPNHGPRVCRRAGSLPEGRGG
jgi:hypothetical protein